MLTILDQFPDALLTVQATELEGVLTGPTLIHLPGRVDRTLFVSILLHGNEDTGLLAIQGLMEKYRGKPLPRRMSILIGNVSAARVGARRLQGQPDYNRIWNGADGAEGAMAQQVIAEMRKRNLFASVDIHNNTGLNPHYAAVTTLDSRTVRLADMFDRRVVYFTKPDTTLTTVFARFCPSIALEAGQAGTVNGTGHAMEFLDACLHLSEIPEANIRTSDLELYHSRAIVRPEKGASFGFGSSDKDINFRDDLDHLNFQLLPEGAHIATVNMDSEIPLKVTGEDGADIRDQYFTLCDGQLSLKRAVMPSMLTIDPVAIAQDCLCYFMDRVEPTGK